MPLISALPAAADDRRRRVRPWLVLIGGFGGLLALMLAAAVDSFVVLERLRTNQESIRQGFISHHSALEQIRTHIYLSGTYVRDYLLAPEPHVADAQRARLASLRNQNRGALDVYARSLEPDERAPFQSLRTEIDAYWRVLDSTFTWSPKQRNRLRYPFFYEELIPRRTSMLQIADRIADINEHALGRAEERLAASAERFRWSLVLTFVITLAGGIALAVLTTGYTLRLERELEHRLDENARSRGELQELSARLVRTQENERRALARELHDEVGQSLSAILMEAGNGESAGDEASMRRHVASIKQLAEETVNVVRDLALLLRPSMLDDFGLVPALKWHARETSKRTGLNVQVNAAESADDLPDEHKTCIYRLVQEAVTNAARHANARNVEVRVTAPGQAVNLTVRDDGAGFDTLYVRGLGLIGMEERVRRLGGHIEIQSEPGRGTLVSVELPLAEMTVRNGTAYAVHSHSAG